MRFSETDGIEVIPFLLLLLSSCCLVWSSEVAKVGRMVATVFGNKLGMHGSGKKLADSVRMYMAVEIVCRAYRKKIGGGDEKKRAMLKVLMDSSSLHYFDRR
jgi:hypothetical protein